MAIVFTCRGGSLAGKRLEFNDPVITFGRRPSSMVRLYTEHEPRVSNVHCEVFQKDDTYFVSDKDSANGTYVNGERIKAVTRLRSGAVLRLSDNGPELVVSFPEDEESPMTMVGAAGNMGQQPTEQTLRLDANQAAQAKDPSATARQQVPPPMDLNAPHKDGIGMATLQFKLDQAKLEVRSEYSSRMKWVYVAVAAVIVVALLLVGWVKFSGDKKLQEMQGQMAESKKDAEKQYNDIKKNTDATTQSKLEQLQALLNDKTSFIEKFATDAKKAGVDSNSMNQEMIRNREALKAIQSQIGDLTAFVSFKERYNKCVYSLVLKFSEGGEVKYSFIGSAFGLSSDPGVLGTTARVVEAVKPLLEEKTYKLVARCNGDAKFSYVVTQTFVHPEFKVADKGVGKDVALLEVDLHSLLPDGTQGYALPLPASLQPAGDDELDQLVSGVNVAVFGFSDLDKAKLEGAAPQTGVATLSTNIVDGTYTFANELVAGGSFGLLKHNCSVMKGFAGAPVVNTKNHVVGVQSNTITLAAARGGLAIPAPNSAYAVNIKTLYELLHTQYPQHQAESK